MKNYDYFYVTCQIIARLESEPLTETDWLLEEEETFRELEEVELKGEEWNPSVNPTPPVRPSVKGKLCRASFYAGVRLDKLLYMQSEVRKGLGLLIGEELRGANARTTKKLFRNFFDAAAIDVFSSAYVTFEKKSGATYFPWGERHKTYVAYDARKSFDNICEYLYSAEFKIGEGLYTVVPNSVKERRARRGIKTG